MGHGRYYLNYHPLLFFVSALYLITKKPYYPAFAYVIGYFSSFVKREEKIDDQEVRDYFRRKRLNEIKNFVFKSWRDILCKAGKSSDGNEKQ